MKFFLNSKNKIVGTYSDEVEVPAEGHSQPGTIVQADADAIVYRTETVTDIDKDGKSIQSKRQVADSLNPSKVAQYQQRQAAARTAACRAIQQQLDAGQVAEAIYDAIHGTPSAKKDPAKLGIRRRR